MVIIGHEVSGWENSQVYFTKDLAVKLTSRMRVNFVPEKLHRKHVHHAKLGKNLRPHIPTDTEFPH